MVVVALLVIVESEHDPIGGDPMVSGSVITGLVDTARQTMEVTLAWQDIWTPLTPAGPPAGLWSRLSVKPSG